MSVTNLATALIIVFVVFVVALTGQFLYVHWRRRLFRRHTSHPPPIRSGNQSPDFPTDDAATKELLYFFCLKPHLSPNKNTDGSSPDDQVVDVFKMLEANGPARFLCTIKEEDKDDIVESTSGVDFPKKPATRDVCLPSCAHLAEEEEVVVVTVDGEDGDVKTEFTTPCDSPLFFTPAGSPSRDFMEMEFDVPVDVTGNIDDR